MRKFEFKKTYEEIEIAGDVYRLELNDDKVKEYQNDFNDFYKESKEIEEIDTTKLSDEEQQELFERSKRLVKGMLDKLLGEGSFDVLYEKSGHSVMNLVDLLLELSDIVGERSQELYDKKKQKYTNKKR